MRRDVLMGRLAGARVKQLSSDGGVGIGWKNRENEGL